ncbi:MAG TPA: hypothetical protein VFA04_16300 [Bryobacteraceae bacterium]|nr:hypothetical protein [Bryobacteraceae bacterium]
MTPLPVTGEYIRQHRDLPDIPSGADVQKNGLNLRETQTRLLAKIEEWTLQMIDVDARNAGLDALVGFPTLISVPVIIIIWRPSDPLAQSLGSAKWPTVFGQDSDAIVPLKSQLAGLTGSTFSGIVHLPGTESLGFNGPAERDPGSISAAIVQLLTLQWARPRSTY